MTLRGAGVALALLLCAAPASGQSQGSDDADISGAWSFKTGWYHVVCEMNGELTLQPTTDPNVFEGRLVAYESCFGGEHRYEAEQHAIAVRDGDQLTITSTLVRVLPSPELYLPDDFELHIVNGGLMLGELRSGTILAKAEFRRGEGLVS